VRDLPSKTQISVCFEFLSLIYWILLIEGEIEQQCGCGESFSTS
jgi:hypothetical protein